MPYSLCEKVCTLEPYKPNLCEYKHKLDANESFFSVDEKIYKQIINSLSEIEFNRYPDPYCNKLCEKFSEFYNINKNLVTVGNGSDELISVIMNSLLMSGDKVITTSPDFSMYNFYAHLSQSDLIAIEKKEDLTLDIDKIIDTANENKAKMIIFSNPCNPTSLGVDADQIAKLISSVDSLIVLDEAYMDFWDQSLLDRAAEFDNLIILKTASKAFGMAAIRLGFAVSNLRITTALKAAKSPYNVNTITQKIGEVLYSNKLTLLNMKDEIVVQRDFLYAELKKLCAMNNKINVYKSRTNFIFIKLVSNTQSLKIYEYLKNKSVLVRLMGDCLRVTASNNADMSAFLIAFEEAVERGNSKC